MWIYINYYTLNKRTETAQPKTTMNHDKKIKGRKKKHRNPQSSKNDRISK